MWRSPEGYGSISSTYVDRSRAAGYRMLRVRHLEGSLVRPDGLPLGLDRLRVVGLHGKVIVPPEPDPTGPGLGQSLGVRYTSLEFRIYERLHTPDEDRARGIDVTTDRGEEPRALGGAELEATIRDLQARVEALEQKPEPRAGRRRRPGPDLGLLDALAELTGPPADDGSPAGTLTYAGVAQLGDESLAWQMIHGLTDLLALDEGALARQLAAIASPVRLRIVRELAAGPLQTHELQARLDEPSAGQLYHHLRELLAAGLVTQPRRSVYEVPARAVIPLFTLVACAHDLTIARDEKDLQ